MAEKQSAMARLREKLAEKAKSYKTSQDVERLHHLSQALVNLRDHTAAAPIAASLAKELSALSAKQTEADAKEKEETDKEVAEAQAADSKSAEQHESPSHAASRSR